MDEDEKTTPDDAGEGEPRPAPLAKGAPLTLEESIERMYERYGRTFEALAK